MSSFSEKLLAELNYQGKSQADLARFLGIKQSSVQSWTQKNSIPAADTALKISRFLNVSLEYLVDDDDSLLNTPKKENNKFFERLKNELDYQNLTRTDLSRALNIPTSLIRNWKEGSMPAADVALKIAKFLKVPLEYLIEGTTPSQFTEMTEKKSEHELPVKTVTEFAKRLEDELNFQGLRKSDIVNSLGLPDSTVRNWWTKNAMPSADVALKVAKFLNVSLEYLIDGTTPPQVIIRKGEKKDSELSDGEKEIVELYGELSDDDKEEIKDIMRVKIKRKEKNTAARDY